MSCDRLRTGRLILPISIPFDAHFSIDSRWFAQRECGKSTSTNGYSLKLRGPLLSVNHSAHSTTLHAMFKVKQNWQYRAWRAASSHLIILL